MVNWLELWNSSSSLGRTCEVFPNPQNGSHHFSFSYFFFAMELGEKDGLHGASLQSSKITEHNVKCCLPFTFLSITLTHQCKCRPPYTTLFIVKLGFVKLGFTGVYLFS